MTEHDHNWYILGIKDDPGKPETRIMLNLVCTECGQVGKVSILKKELKIWLEQNDELWKDDVMVSDG